MSASEAVAFHALRRFVGARLPAAVTMDIEPLFKAADTRLAQDREDSRHYRAWSNKIGSVESTYQLIRPPIDPAIFHTVTTAAFFERELLVKYHPAYRPATAEDDLPKRIWPLALVESSGLMYLIVQLPERSPNSKQGRANPLRVLYRVDRILSAVDTGHVFAYPRDFRLKDMIEEDKTLDFQPEPPVVLELAVDRQNAKRLRESHMSKDQKFDPESLPDGRFKVTGTVVPSVKLRWWLRSLGAGVEVLAPPSLREEFAREAAALAKRYGM